MWSDAAVVTTDPVVGEAARAAGADVIHDVPDAAASIRPGLRRHPGPSEGRYRQPAGRGRAAGGPARPAYGRPDRGAAGGRGDVLVHRWSPLRSGTGTGVRSRCGRHRNRVVGRAAGCPAGTVFRIGVRRRPMWRVERSRCTVTGRRCAGMSTPPRIWPRRSCWVSESTPGRSGSRSGRRPVRTVSGAGPPKQ